MSKEPFLCEPGLRLQALERVHDIHNTNFERRLDRVEELMARLEKRLWLAVYGVVAAILAQAFQSLLAMTPV